MTSTELKHQANLQKWSQEIQACRSSGLPVKQWCRERGVTPTSYYRWERQILGVASSTREISFQEPFVELPVPRKMNQQLRNVPECSATLRIGNGCIEIYQSLDAELLKMMITALQSC